MMPRRWGSVLLLLGLLVPGLGQAQTVPVASSLTIQGQISMNTLVVPSGNDPPNPCVLHSLFRELDATAGQQLKMCTQADPAVWTVQGDGGAVTDGDKGDITVAAGVWGIDASTVALGDIANIGAGTILGNNEVGAGAPEALTTAEAKTLLGLGNASFTGPTTAHTYTLPDADATLTTTANKLSVFAATTSAELAGVLSDENATNGFMTNPMTTAGDLLYGGASGVLTRLAPTGTDEACLTYDTGTNAPHWVTCPSGSGTVNSGVASTVAYYPATAAAVDDSTALTLSATELLASAPRITTKNATGNLTTSDGPVVACTAGASDITLTLPAGASTTQRHWSIVKVDAGAGHCLVDGNGTDTINGGTGTAAAATQWSRVDLDLSQTGGTPNWSAVFGKTTLTPGDMTFTATDRLYGRDTAGAGVGEELAPTAVKTLLAIACADLTDEGGGCAMSTTAGGDLTGTLPSPTITTGAVTYAKMQDVSAASRLLGRGSAAGAGDPQELTVGTLLTISGTVLNLEAPAADDQLYVSDSATDGTWRTLTDCTGTNKAVTYATAGNTFGCNTISVGTGDVLASGTPSDNQLAIWTAAAQTIEGVVALTYTGGVLTVGVDATTSGSLVLANGNATGDSVTIQNISTTAGAWNFNLPTTAGSSGQVLTSAGGGTSPMTWSTPLTNPMTTAGDIIIGGASGTPTRLAGAAGFLKGAVGSGPSYAAVDLSSTDASGTLAAARFPALTGAVTTTAGNLATTLATKYLTQTTSAVIDAPVAGDTNKVQWYFPTAVTITRVACSVSGTTSVVIQLDERAEATPNTAGTNVMTSTLTCDADSANTTSFANATIAARVPLNLQIGTITGTPTSLRVHVEYTID